MRTPSGARRRATLGWGLLVLAIVGAGAGVHAEGPPTRHVLFLNSYRHGVEWSDDLRPLDAIVAADDEALTFLLEHRDELFPGVPVVFMRINNADLFARADPKSYTGLREELRTGDIVDLGDDAAPGHSAHHRGGRRDVDRFGPARCVPRGGRAAARALVCLPRRRAHVA